MSYVPNPEPSGPVDYIFVCMEPSLGGWAKSVEHGRERVKDGFRNFLAGIEPMLLHFSARQYLCKAGEGYHLTDFSKGAMLVEHAGRARRERYDRWYEFLTSEIELLSKPNTLVVAVGKEVQRHLARRQGEEITSIVHYSPLAAQGRNQLMVGHEEAFGQFSQSVTKAQFVRTARDVLDESGVPEHIYQDAFSRIERATLSESRKKLIFAYKRVFEALQLRCRNGSMRESLPGRLAA